MPPAKAVRINAAIAGPKVPNVLSNPSPVKIRGNQASQDMANVPAIKHDISFFLMNSFILSTLVMSTFHYFRIELYNRLY